MYVCTLHTRFGRASPQPFASMAGQYSKECKTKSKEGQFKRADEEVTLTAFQALTTTVRLDAGRTLGS